MIFYMILGGILCLALIGLVPMLVITYPISKKVYYNNLVKSEPEKWGRVCSAPDNEEQLQMWNDGIAWAKEQGDVIREVEIEHDGLRLYGEYFDYGSDRCVIIVPGRCECLMYSYYFAPAYQKAGMNILVIDSRAHGKSDGKYSTIGVKESEDIRQWVKLLEEQFGIREIYFHGICVGTSSALFLMEKEDCPKSVKGLVTEGCYVSFRETFRTHMIADKRPLFPVLDLVMLHIWRHTGTNVYWKKPIRSVKKIKQRVLFLFGEKDIFSLPEKSKKLFAACASEDKKLVWFDKGGHSHLRINNTEKYDDTIIEFVNQKRN